MPKSKPRRRNTRRSKASKNRKNKATIVEEIAQEPIIKQKVNPELNALVRLAGSGLANYLMPGTGALGDMLANQGHKLFKRITGYGDYTVKSNSLINDSVPIFSKQRGFRYKNREFLTDIVSGPSNAFSVVYSQPIQPSNLAMFPWLSSVAQNFEEYRLHGMIFEFKTTSVDALNSTNTALGSVILATQYNPLDPVFVTKQQMENYEFVSSTKPSASVMHPIECAPQQTPIKQLYVRHANEVSTSSDARLYDFGTFSLATVGMQASNVTIGELWVSYDCEFFKPRLPGNTVLFLMEANNGTSAISSSGVVNLLGTAPVTVSTLRGVTLVGDSILWDAKSSGLYKIVFSLSPVTLSSSSSYIIGTPSGAVVKDTTYPEFATLINAPSTSGMMYSVFVSVSGAGSLRLTSANFGFSNVTSSELYIENVTGIVPV